MVRKPKKRGVDAKGRNTGESFVGLENYMLNSAAYRSLTLGGRALLTDLHMLFKGENNGELFLSHREAADRLPCDPKSAGKYFKELEDRGFIKTNVKGCFSNKTKLASSYVLTNKRYNGRPPTKDFMKWKPLADEKTRRENFRVTAVKNSHSAPEEWPQQ